VERKKSQSQKSKPPPSPVGELQFRFHAHTDLPTPHPSLRAHITSAQSIHQHQQRSSTLSTASLSPPMLSSTSLDDLELRKRHSNDSTVAASADKQRSGAPFWRSLFRPISTTPPPAHAHGGSGSGSGTPVLSSSPTAFSSLDASATTTSVVPKQSKIKRLFVKQ
jgi:hypothetical protein